MATAVNKQIHGSASLRAAFAGVLALGFFSGAVQGQIYKVVDADGNVTYTDQAPSDGAAPMVLPELSVVDTDYVPETPATQDDTAQASDGDAAEDAAPTPRQLRKMFKDFHISRPSHEETFWGTANSVVISWVSSKPLLPGMSVQVYIDGQRQADGQDGMLAVTLDRGEHQVYAELMDARGRRVVTSPTVTFFVKQHSIGFNRPSAASNNGT